jgi:hypothetical protein
MRHVIEGLYLRIHRLSAEAKGPTTSGAFRAVLSPRTGDMAEK